MPSMAITEGMKNDAVHDQPKFGLQRLVFSLGRQRKTKDYVTVGSQFRRERPDQMVETAKVISVANDGLGIPHVRYELKISKLKSVTSFNVGHRSLALETFTKTYKTLV